MPPVNNKADSKPLEQRVADQLQGKVSEQKAADAKPQVVDESDLPVAVRDELRRLRDKEAEVRQKEIDLEAKRVEQEEYFDRRMAEVDSIASRRNEDMERRFAALEERLEKSQSTAHENAASSAQQIAQLAARAAMLEKASVENIRRVGETGITVKVKRGDPIMLDVRTGRGGIVRGGWFKCNLDQKVSRDIPLVGIANEPFEYDAGVGAVQHSVKYKPYRRYFKDPERNQLVSGGDPTPSPLPDKNPILLIPQRLGIVPAHSF